MIIWATKGLNFVSTFERAFDKRHNKFLLFLFLGALTLPFRVFKLVACHYLLLVLLYTNYLKNPG